MKITWFAGRTFRIHLGGKIIVTAPNAAPDGIDATELVSGADVVVSSDTAIADIDVATYRPRRRGRFIDEAEEEPVLSLYRPGSDGLLADSADDGVVVLAVEPLEWGRWADGSVVILAGTSRDCSEQGCILLGAARPKLIALAIAEGEIDAVFDVLATQLGDAGLVVLEPGLAVEV